MSKDKEIDDRLQRLDDSTKKPLVGVEHPYIGHPKPVGQSKKESNMIDIRTFREAIDRGAVLQIYRKKDKLVMEATPLFSKWLLYSICFNALILAILFTKIIGLW